MLLDERLRKSDSISMSEERRMTRLFRYTFTLAIAAAPTTLTAQSAPQHALSAASTVAKDITPTFAKDVAPIFQAKCQVCHQPNSIAPMSLISYDEAKKYAGKIKARVVSRVMPPWHLDKSVGIQSFKNDRSLTDAQIETIAKWVDAGAPMGDPKDMPPAAKFPDPNAWQLAEKFGPPDLVVTSKSFTVPAKGEDKWFRPLVETGVTEPRWVRAIEVRPSFPNGRKVVHHALAYLLQDEKGVTGLASTAMDMNMGPGLFMEWAVGKTGQIFPGDAGKLMLPGSRIKWEIHVHSNGEEAKDNTVQLAVYFYPKGFVPQHRTVLKMFDVTRGSDLDIPPNEKSITQNFYVMQAPARIENFQPHMHMRGKAMSMEAIYPDGRREVLSSVNNFQWKWHNNYVYSDSAAPLLPKGTTLVFTAWHDNTASNPNNPDPTQWVGWGDRTVDEMAHCWIDVTYMDQADFDKALAARKTAKMAGMTMP
jgi:hypothetical protein